MGPITMLFGAVLIALGLIGYIPTHAGTALIPAGFGVVLLLLGALALKENMRKHAMHLAAMLGLIGLVAALYRPIMAVVGGTFDWTTPVILQVSMAATCGIFVALCVKSFIDARRRRKQAGP